MIDYIKGELAEISPAAAVIEAAGVGYELLISLNTFTAIRGQKQVRLYVHEQLVTGGRDDGMTLYGFLTKQERQLYRMLLTVNGVGGGTARMMLSALSAAELCDAITDGDERLLRSIKGIGPKAAQRIILELRDKLLQSGITADIHSTSAGGTQTAPVDREVRDEAVGALTMLGFSPAPVAKVVGEIMRQEPDLTVEQVVKKALKLL